MNTVSEHLSDARHGGEQVLRGHLTFETVQHRQASAARVLLDQGGDTLADARQALQTREPPRPSNLADRVLELPSRSRPVQVRSNAVRVRSLRLEQCGDAFQGIGDLGIVEIGSGSSRGNLAQSSGPSTDSV
jgi:hypothetical protein